MRLSLSIMILICGIMVWVLLLTDGLLVVRDGITLRGTTSIMSVERCGILIEKFIILLLMKVLVVLIMVLLLF